MVLIMIRLIEVTSKHIEDGQGGSCTLCPIALALQEEYKTIDVEVDNCGSPNLLVNKKGLLIDHSQLCDVQDFIELFDENHDVDREFIYGTVKPFTLRITESI